MSLFGRGWVLLGVLGSVSCSSVSRDGDLGWLTQSGDAKEAVRLVCQVAPDRPGVQGSVVMKAKSKEASGQFPAGVRASAQDGLRIEVTTLLGARAALIEIRGNDFKVETADQGSVSKKAKSWGGIPLEWAAALFMDQVPCPSLTAPGLTWQISPDGDLLGRVPGKGEAWRYKLTSHNRRVFVQNMRLERSGLQVIELNREDADPVDSWARRWEIKSPAGEVKVRWRERKSL